MKNLLPLALSTTLVFSGASSGIEPTIKSEDIIFHENEIKNYRLTNFNKIYKNNYETSYIKSIQDMDLHLQLMANLIQTEEKNLDISLKPVKTIFFGGKFNTKKGSLVIGLEEES